MSKIVSELDWLSSEEPTQLALHARGKVDSQRFRWLAADWGSRIRHVFEPDDIILFDAFSLWVAGKGPHPSELNLGPGFTPLDMPLANLACARRFADAIRRDDPLRAAAFAGESVIEDYPFVPLSKPDFSHAHRPKAASKRALEKSQDDVHRETWWKAKAAHEKNVCREFCNQLRDVAGNPFRPVTVLPEWRTAAVVDLAQSIGNESAFDRLPILADALEDAGCRDVQILDHCRGKGPHVRGCWVIELLTVENHNR